MYEKQSKCSVFYFLPKTVQRICRPVQNRLPRDYIYKENYKTKYLRLFTLCSYLITNESYDRWITRRKWEFRHQISEAKYLKQNIWSKISQNVGYRHQISKAKYLKMSVGNIGKLQENTAALCRKISQNVGRTYQEASGEHRGTVQNGCETL